MNFDPQKHHRRSIRLKEYDYTSVVTRRIGHEFNATGIWQRNYGACPELVEGSTRFAITKTGIESIGTLKPTHPCGRRMKKIP